jgi:hypothetical protein
MSKAALRARMLTDNCIAAGGVTLTALNPIRSMCERLCRDGYDPSLSLQIWKGAAPWLLVFAIGAPDHHVKLKARNGGS